MQINNKNGINLAVIGIGTFGIEHIKTLQSMRGVHLWGICDKNEERLQCVAEKYNIQRIYLNAEKLLQEEKLDGVIIATDEESHVPLTKKATLHKKHVLLEKPVATSVKLAENLLHLDTGTDTIIMPGHMLRFDTGYAEIKESLSKINEPIKSLRVKRNVPIERFKVHSRTHPVFMALSHDIDQLVWHNRSLPKRIYAMQRNVDLRNETPGIIFGLIEMEDGMICSLETQWCLPNEYGQYLDVEFEAMVDNGHFKYQYPGNNIHYMYGGTLKQPDIQLSPSIHGNVSGALRSELEHFINQIEDKVTPIIKMDEAVLGIKICNAIIQSAQKQRELRWEEL